MLRRVLPLAVATALLAAPAAHAATSSSEARLADAVNSYSRALGVPRDSAPAIKKAGLSTSLAGKLADEVDQLHRCDALSRAWIPAIREAFSAGLPEGTAPVMPFTSQRSGDSVLGSPLVTLPNPMLPANFPFEDEVRRCGEASVSRLGALRTELTGKTVPSLDLWPVLRLSPGRSTFVHDYVLLVVTAGDNAFLNNAGGSGIDIWRGPAGSGAQIEAPARGCIDAFDLIRERTCTMTSAALLVLGGHNTFGRLEAPDPQTDAYCTADPVSKRVFVQAAGVIGVGAAIVVGSDNQWFGKVLTTGVGHIGGFGYLRADGDRNHYTLIRSGLGASVVGGIGQFVANGNDNVYSYYTPRPTDPSAQPGTPGSGGVVNDLNGCDNGNAITLGSGQVGGIGAFEANGVGNSYTAGRDSLGTGKVLGKGSFFDGAGGTETYAGPGAVGRANNITILPTSSNNGTFIDQ
jgi:hypothetical protein